MNFVWLLRKKYDALWERHPRLMLVVFLGVFLCAGVIGGFFIPRREMSECNKKYRFINAKIVCGEKDVIRKTGYIEIQEKINDLIKAKRDDGAIAETAVYFRDLEHGPTFGINELASFAPASLLKIPLAFVYLRSAEIHPELLKDKIKFTGTADNEWQRIKPKESAMPNESYSIEDLLRLMLAYSDNTSYDILEQFLADSPRRMSFRKETFQEIGLIEPKDLVEETITVRGYASLFRILYNVSFLNPELSEKMLTWLAESDYRDGLVTGVPQGISVAHKFGERVIEPTGDKQLHDCGIVYYPGNPYLLCIMTKGNDWNELTDTIATISKMVYEEVDSKRY